MTPFETISYELAKLSNLMSALELATCDMTCEDSDYARQQRDATVGLVDVMRGQIMVLRSLAEGLERDEP